MSHTKRLMYQPRAWNWSLYLWAGYLLLMHLLTWTILDEPVMDWFRFQENWIMPVFLCANMLVFHMALHTWGGPRWAKAKESRFWGARESFRHVQPMPLRAWVALGFMVAVQTVLLAALPARLFQGYRGDLAQGSHLAMNLIRGPGGRVAYTDTESTFSPTRGVLRAREGGRSLWSQTLGEQGVYRMAWSRDGSRIALLRFESKALELRDGGTGQLLRTLNEDGLGSFAWHPDGSLWARTEAGLLRWGADGSKTLLWAQPRLDDVALTPDGGRVVLKWGSEKGHRIALRDAASLTVLKEWDLPVPIHRMLPLPGGTRLVMEPLRSERQGLRLWSMEEGRFIDAIPDLEFLDRAALSPDGRWLAGFRKSGRGLWVFDLEHKGWHGVVPAGSFSGSMVFSEDSKELWASGSWGWAFPFALAGPIHRWSVAALPKAS